MAWRGRVALGKRAAYRDESYWGRPVPGFGDERARLLIIGLAPAAHGANRTGRMFTGDESGRWLYRALHRAGFANQAESTQRSDGMELLGARITAAVRCAPPANRPTPQECARCLPFLAREIVLCRRARVFVCLGGFAWMAALRALRALGTELPRPLSRFAHAAETRLGARGPWLLGSYHPSQQNTFTKRLTEPMLDAVMSRAAELTAERALDR